MDTRNVGQKASTSIQSNQRIMVNWEDFEVNGQNPWKDFKRLNQFRKALGLTCEYKVSGENRKFSVGLGTRKQMFNYDENGIKLFGEYLRLEWSDQHAVSMAQEHSNQNSITTTYEKSAEFRQRIEYLGWRFGYLKGNDTVFGLVYLDFHNYHPEVNALIRDHTFENLFEVMRLVVDAEARYSGRPELANYPKIYLRTIDHFAAILA